MATRGRPKGSKNKPSNHIIIKKMDLEDLQMDNEDLHKIKDALSISNTKLLEHLSEKAKVIEEQESEIGKLEDENEHLKEIIKSLAEVL